MLLKTTDNVLNSSMSSIVFNVRLMRWTGVVQTGKKQTDETLINFILETKNTIELKAERSFRSYEATGFTRSGAYFVDFHQ